MSSITTNTGQQFLLLMPCSRCPWQEVKSPKHNFSCLKQIKLFHSSAALPLTKTAAQQNSSQPKKRRVNKRRKEQIINPLPLWWAICICPALPGCHGILPAAARSLPSVLLEHHSSPEWTAHLVSQQGYCAWNKDSLLYFNYRSQNKD